MTNLNRFLNALTTYVCEKPAALYGETSVLAALYECHNESNPYDTEEIKADFNKLYQAMNGLPLRDMDRIIDPVCALCRDHEKAGFIEGLKIGIRLHQELTQDSGLC